MTAEKNWADIKPVTRDLLTEAMRGEGGAMDPGSHALREAELQYINERRAAATPPLPPAPSDKLAGLALSGGGIRSATFCLGIMQALANQGLLERFHYLSTVSGGGYIGTSFMWWVNANRGSGATADTFPYGSEPPYPSSGAVPRTDSTEQYQRLWQLRGHANYLRAGQSYGMILRGIVLNFLVWLPILVALMAVVIFIGTWLAYALSEAAKNLSILRPSEAFGALVKSWFGDDAYVRIGLVESVWLISLLLALLVVLFVALCLLYSLDTYVQWKGPGYTYADARRFEGRSGLLFSAMKWVIFALLILTVPITLQSHLHEWGEGIRAKLPLLAGLVPTISGLVLLVSGRMESIYRGWAKPLTQAFALGGAVLVIGGTLYTIFLVGAWFTCRTLTSSLLIQEVKDVLVPPLVAQKICVGTGASGWEPVWLVGLVFFSLITGYFSNLNLLTLHRFYRGRLMNAFMPDQEEVATRWYSQKRVDHDTSLADETLLCDVQPPTPGPYHLINANLILVGSEQQPWKSRGGDSFLLSRLFCGSNATGWRRTAAYMDGQLTLATAMATSGAAFNPYTGSGGPDLLRNRLISVLMAILNLRLGFWVYNPNLYEKGQVRPNHFVPGLYDVDNRHYNECASDLQLTDGGHFDNLALYELIRRRLKVVVVCDGAEDAEFKFEDVLVIVKRVAEDFGTIISFDAQNNPALLVPSVEIPYPKGTKLAAQGYIVCDIKYPGSQRGTLIYIKATMTSTAPPQAIMYKSVHPKFPDQSTADQFFDEDQFEAYRMLGYAMGMDMATKIKLHTLI